MIRLEVIGTPKPQGSKSAFQHKTTGKVVMTDGKTPGTRAAFKSWREGVAAEARSYQKTHRLELVDEPVSVVITFRMPRPKSKPKRVVHPAVKPDLDKLVRAVLDGIKGTVLFDDSRVINLAASKVYAVDEPPGCVITISPIAVAVA